jgi:hypothetical protein
MERVYGTLDTHWPIVSSQYDGWMVSLEQSVECVAGETDIPAPLCPPQIPCNVTRAGTRATAGEASDYPRDTWHRLHASLTIAS